MNTHVRALYMILFSSRSCKLKQPTYLQNQLKLIQNQDKEYLQYLVDHRSIIGRQERKRGGIPDWRQSFSHPWSSPISSILCWSDINANYSTSLTHSFPFHLRPSSNTEGMELVPMFNYFFVYPTLGQGGYTVKK